MMRCQHGFSVLLALLSGTILMRFAGAPVASWHSEQTRRIRCAERFYEYTISSPEPHAALPAIVLLHGAGGTSSDIMSAWRSLARRERVVLIAPQLPRELAFESQAPAVFRCMVSDAERTVSIDDQRIYLFGYSMGGYLAFDGAMFDSDVFAAAGMYGAAINADYYAIVDSARRTMPITMYIGDRDPFYPVAQARNTRALLESHGFPVRYTEFPGQDHAYGPVSRRVNDDAWAFFSSIRLGHSS